MSSLHLSPPCGKATAHILAHQPLLAKLHIAFFAMSVLIGAVAVAVNPPLRAPDETAHFLRAFGISQGEIIPRAVDAGGRRGLWLPPDLHQQLRFFNELRETLPGPDGRYGDVMRRYFDQDRSVPKPPAAPAFMPYEGSEAYSPVPYIPYAAAAWIGTAGRLDFLGLLYLMRAVGLLVASLLIAYAIAITPRLKPLFFCTAMLPTAIYARAAVSVDGAVLSSTLVVIALVLRRIEAPDSGTVRRASWMTICCLTKPSQCAFILLELMHGSREAWSRRWRKMLLVVLPGLILSLLWVLVVAGDVGAWRIREGSGLPPEEFDPTWKLLFLLQHPAKFISAAAKSLDYTPELWRQMIGVFGWLDVPMRSLAYPVISLLLAATLFERLNFDSATRIRTAVICASTLIGYCVAVLAIFFITLTPTSADRVYGLQGRYFVVLVPLLGLVISATVNRGAGRIGTLAALAGALVSAAFMLDALWLAHW